MEPDNTCLQVPEGSKKSISLFDEYIDSLNRTKYLELKEHPYELFAFTLNPLAGRRITYHQPYPSKSQCKKYMNYTVFEQKEILDQLFTPFNLHQHDDIFFEQTKRGDLHMHTTLKLTAEDLPYVALFQSKLNKQCGNKEEDYTACDIKHLQDRGAVKAWKAYIRKDQNK